MAKTITDLAELYSSNSWLESLMGTDQGHNNTLLMRVLGLFPKESGNSVKAKTTEMPRNPKNKKKMEEEMIQFYLQTSVFQQLMLWCCGA